MSSHDMPTQSGSGSQSKNAGTITGGRPVAIHAVSTARSLGLEYTAASRTDARRRPNCAACQRPTRDSRKPGRLP